MPNKAETAKILADAHRRIEPTISRIIRLIAEQEQETEPIKLLEVNPETSPAGVLPIVFGAAPPQVPFPSVIVEVTEEEFEDIRAGRLSLPQGWRLGDELYPNAA
jgi:hypothetical protein